MKKGFILLLLYATCAFFAPVQAQRIPIVNGWKYAGGGSPAPSFPTTNALFAFAGNNGVTHSSNVVSAWDDIIGTRDATQSSSSNRPDWNGTNAITFTASNNDYLTVAYAPSGTLNIYMVIRIDNLATTSYIAGEIGATFTAFDGGTDKIGVSDGVNAIYQSNTIANTSTFYLIHIHVESGTNASYIAVNNGSNTTGTLTLGTFASPYYIGALKNGSSPFAYGNMTLKDYRVYGSQSSTDISNMKAAYNYTYSLW
jgi:hypothetical protein